MFLQEKESTHLCFAARENNCDAIIAIIEEGVTDINVAPSSTSGCTPLHYACAKNNYEAAQLLIFHGADLYQLNEKGKTPWDLLKDKTTFLAKSLRAEWGIIKQTQKYAPNALMYYSLFARKHVEQLDPENQESISMLSTQLASPDGVKQINKELKILAR